MYVIVLHSQSLQFTFLITSARGGGHVFGVVCLFVCLSVSQQDNGQITGPIFKKVGGSV